MKGIYTALATPFNAQGAIDWAALDRILSAQVESGLAGGVVSGTTGESPTLDDGEWESLLRHVMEFVRRSGKPYELVAGTGTNDTRETVAKTKKAEALGYRKFLVVVPYYNKPTPEGLRRHFLAVADAVSEGEVVLYNVPGRTGIGLTSETIVELAAHPRIRALKEASGKIDFLKELISSLKNRGRSLDLLSGDDATYFDFICAGGVGNISVASHLCPKGLLEIEKAVAAGDIEAARRTHERFLPLFQDLFIEPNPIPLKWFLSRLGFCENTLRLPLVPVSREGAIRLEQCLQRYTIREKQLC